MGSVPPMELQETLAAERAMIMRNQGFIHPSTLVPEELEYSKRYEARINKLNKKFRPMHEKKSDRKKAK